MASIREIAEHAQIPAPVADARLFQACAGLASVVPEDGVVAYSAVEFALQTNGIIEPSPHVLVVRASLRNHGGIVAALRPQLEHIIAIEHPTLVGVGTFPLRNETGLIVVALLQSHLRTSPIPRVVSAGAHLDFTVDVAPEYRVPGVRVTRPTGESLHVPLRRGPDGMHVDIDCGSASGRLQVEIHSAADGRAEVLANFPLWCDAQPPRSLEVGQPANDLPSRPEEAEQRIFALVNTERQKAGLAALVWDDQLADTARAHSWEMQRSGVIAQRLPSGVSVRERVRALRPQVNVHAHVARAYGVAEVHQGFFGLPSTREALLSASMTRMGVGITYGKHVDGNRQELFITEVLSDTGP